MANYEITVYEINKQTYDALMKNPANRKILANARPVKRVAVKLESKKEPISIDAIKNCLGGIYNNCICYNLDTDEYNNKIYNGSSVYGDITTRRKVQKLKDLLAIMPQFKNCEPLAISAMTTGHGFYTENKEWMRTPEYFIDGNCVVINMIVRDLQSGEIKFLQKNHWFGAWTYPSSKNAAQFCISDFILRMCQDGNYRRAFAKGK